MKTMVQFHLDRSQKENVFRRFQEGGLQREGIAVEGVWIAAKTGLAFILLETDDALKLWEFCSEWSDYGEVVLDPVVEAGRIG